MCACNLNVVPVAQAVNYQYAIPVGDFTTKKSRCEFQVAYCGSPEKVNIALNPYGIKIPTMDKMIELADYYDSGKALAYYKVDLREVLSKIEFTPEEKEKLECKTVCAVY